MNSNFNKFDFDLGIGSNSRSSKSLNDQKNKSGNSYSYSYSSSTSSFSQPKTTPSWQPGKPAWTHQPAPSQPSVTRTELGVPASMVGDIMGKSWNSTAPPQQKVAVASSIGIVNKNPNLFGDLVNSALGQNKGVGGSNVPLKSATPVKNSFSMGGVADSLPKTGNASGYGNVSSDLGKIGGGGGGGGWGSFQSSVSGATNNVSLNMGSGVRVGGGGGGGMSSNTDPFASFVDISSKPMKNGVGTGPIGVGSAAKPAAIPSSDIDFGGFQSAPKPNPSTFSSGNSKPLGSNPKINSFGTQNQSPPVQSGGADSFDILFSSTSATDGVAAGGEKMSGGDDEWGFGGGHDNGGTTELDGLPPPPAGVSALTAKTKGLDNYKQGQYADAIKWLSWAELLLEKHGDTAGSMDVLSCRASCYKEVGEYKKAVADCTKVLSHDEKNVAVLVQRALLYESMEKYRLGADDLRTVMKLDPGNRVARSTIHRLNKMAD
ncbi:hypothetical protein RND81_14G062500 [Saponaria officinalis]|uniref:Uncharacterized protein n=1 Tax=Saponaria officinalis TaxID=3572 RepID=A0AAW1GM31_SAPOF